MLSSLEENATCTSVTPKPNTNREVLGTKNWLQGTGTNSSKKSSSIHPLTMETVQSSKILETVNLLAKG